MGIKRPLKPEVRKQYGKELAIAEQMAQQGFDPKTKTLDESIYGPTTTKFDPFQEMQELVDNNITDNSFMEASMKDIKVPQEAASLEEAAVQAVIAEQIPVEDKGLPVPQSFPEIPPVKEPKQSAEERQEEPEEENTLSADPAERLKQVAEQLKSIIGSSAPSEEQLKQWKVYHGDVFILQLDTKIFIYRYLKRQEWIQMQSNEAIQRLRPDQHEDLIFNKCVLWPQMSPQLIAGLPAGAVSTIVEQIRLQSMFLDPMQVANITIKL